MFSLSRKRKRFLLFGTRKRRRDTLNSKRKQRRIPLAHGGRGGPELRKRKRNIYLRLKECSIIATSKKRNEKSGKGIIPGERNSQEGRTPISLRRNRKTSPVSSRRLIAGQIPEGEEFFKKRNLLKRRSFNAIYVEVFTHYKRKKKIVPAKKEEKGFNIYAEPSSREVGRHPGKLKRKRDTISPFKSPSLVLRKGRRKGKGTKNNWSRLCWGEKEISATKRDGPNRLLPHHKKGEIPFPIKRKRVKICSCPRAI